MKELIEGNRRYAAERTKADPDYFARLSRQQAPEYFWIGCSDSRVPANVITGLDPGEVFVHRNVANLVNPGDLNCLSALQFAVEVLKVKHVIVCGHHTCGGVQAVINRQKFGVVDYWLRPLAELADQHADQLNAIQDMEERTNLLCDLSIRKQVERLAATPIIQGAWARGQKLSIYGCYYELKNGLLHNLECTLVGGR